MPIKTTPFEPEKYFRTPDAQTRLVNDAISTGDAGYIADALGIVARARGMSDVAREAGVTREALYKSLAPGGDPKLSTFLGVIRVLGGALSYKTEAPKVRKAAKQRIAPMKRNAPAKVRNRVATKRAKATV